jgi:hypothetical protein
MRKSSLFTFFTPHYKVLTYLRSLLAPFSLSVYGRIHMRRNSFVLSFLNVVARYQGVVRLAGQKGKRSGKFEFTVTCLILFIAFNECLADGKKLYVAEDQMLCENMLVEAYTTCTEESRAVGLSECTDQFFIFNNPEIGGSSKVSGSGELRYRLGAHGRPMGRWLDSLAWSWACLKGSRASFIVVAYSNGGNCSGCEWWEIFDLTGKKLAGSKVPPSRGDEALREADNAFDKEYDLLGLPRPWPRALFRRIHVFKFQRGQK